MSLYKTVIVGGMLICSLPFDTYKLSSPACAMSVHSVNCKLNTIDPLFIPPLYAVFFIHIQYHPRETFKKSIKPARILLVACVDLACSCERKQVFVHKCNTFMLQDMLLAHVFKKESCGQCCVPSWLSPSHHSHLTQFLTK